MEKLICIGAGRHAKVVIEMLLAKRQFELIGLLDNNTSLHGMRIFGSSVLGPDSILPQLLTQGVKQFMITVASNEASGNKLRHRLFDEAILIGLIPAILTHASSIISPSALVGPGTMVLSGAIVNTSAVIGKNCIINSGAIIEHDDAIGDHVHICPGSRLGGSVQVQEGAFIGLGAVVKHDVHIGSYATIGAGSVVLEDVPAGATVVGSPARLVKQSSGMTLVEKA